MIIKVNYIRNGIRVVIEKEKDGFRIRSQEHKSICGGYIEDADNDGWRDCMVSFEYDIENAGKETERVSSHL